MRMGCASQDVLFQLLSCVASTCISVMKRACEEEGLGGHALDILVLWIERLPDSLVVTYPFLYTCTKMYNNLLYYLQS